MTIQNIFKGLGIALVTPFKTDGSVDYEALTRLIDYQLDNGADFLCILATTGETPCLTAEEKLTIKNIRKKGNAITITINLKIGKNHLGIQKKDIEMTFIDGLSDKTAENDLFLYASNYIRN